jgi:hypothetical protein
VVESMIGIALDYQKVRSGEDTIGRHFHFFRVVMTYYDMSWISFHARFRACLATRGVFVVLYRRINCLDLRLCYLSAS